MADKPSDIASASQLRKQLKQFSALRKVWPIARPLLKLMGTDVSKIEGALDQFRQQEQALTDLTHTPDRFNELFGSRGWIAYDWLSTETAKTAVATAEAGKLEEAEKVLVDHYTEEQVRIQLKTLLGLSSFRPRVRLLFRDLSINARAGELRAYYEHLVLSDFAIEEIIDIAPAATEIVIKGRGTQYSKPFDGSGRFRLVNLDATWNPVINGSSGGTWFITTWNPWQNAGSLPEASPDLQ